jgi:alpha-glucosidase
MKLLTSGLFLLLSYSTIAQKNKTYQISSPDGKNVITVDAGDLVKWSLMHEASTILTPSVISMQLQSGEILGDHAKIKSTKTEKVNTTFKAIDYIKDIVPDVYNQLTLNCKGDYGIIFKAYNDGVAYRFFTKKKGQITIVNESTNFNFDKDYKCYIPFVRDFRGKEQYIQSFEALYTEKRISEFSKDTLGFLPIMADLGNQKKVVITEADLEDYPGMFLQVNNESPNSLKGVHAPYPLEVAQGGYKMLNTMVTKRADFISRVDGTRSFPWRVVIICNSDTSLLNNDMVQKLASPNRIADPSWIKPGKVAWDWWNDWNISHVDFRAGINTETYKYYIDFAAANKLEYIIIDEGWSNDLDLMDVSPNLNLQEIIDHGKQKNVGVILWAGWYAIHSKMDSVFAKYSAMGAKGFKIDFMDRDDQKMVASLYDIAKMAAEHKMIIDYHGMYKPTGLQRTWPNVVNFECVKGMENVKWTPNDDVPHYDVTIPFIRMVAGQMDYTPGAMRNATWSNFRPINSLPESQGTRCHQLAMYVMFFAPLQMLADNPTVYMKEQECTDFIDLIPTVFDQTVPLLGEVGSFAAIARRKGDAWYIGAMSNWDARDLNIDFSFLGKGNFKAEIFQDGINADRDATDYNKVIKNVTADTKMKIHIAPGGGWAARITPD